MRVRVKDAAVPSVTSPTEAMEMAGIPSTAFVAALVQTLGEALVVGEAQSDADGLVHVGVGQVIGGGGGVLLMAEPFPRSHW